MTKDGFMDRKKDLLSVLEDWHEQYTLPLRVNNDKLQLQYQNETHRELRKIVEEYFGMIKILKEMNDILCVHGHYDYSDEKTLYALGCQLDKAFKLTEQSPDSVAQMDNSQDTDNEEMDNGNGI